VANKRANRAETEVASDAAQQRSILTGEVLREWQLCPLVLIRSWDAGVHVGLLARYDAQNGDVELLQSRRLWRWRGANTLHEVSLYGVSDEYTRLSEAVPHAAVTDVCEVIPVSDKAAPSLTRSRWGE